MNDQERNELARQGLRRIAVEILQRLKSGEAPFNIADEAFNKSCDMYFLFEGPLELEPGDGGTAKRRDMVRTRRWVLNGGPAQPDYPRGPQPLPDPPDDDDSDVPF